MPGTARPHANVTVTSRAMWRISMGREIPRYLLQGMAVAGLLASARFAIAPPRPTPARVSTPRSALVDRAAEGFASLFARRYLTWDAHDPEAHRLGLTPYLGSSMEVEAGLQPPESGEQRVQWTQVVQVRSVTSSERVYTVAVQTDTGGLLYLTVGVERAADGRLALSGYPAFVGAPASSVARSSEHGREVEDPALVTVVMRALRNYLARAESELDADLAAGARVSLPAAALALRARVSVDWSPDGRSVLAVVRARDQRGAQYTLGYEIDVVNVDGRWEVSAIEVNPDT